MKPALAIVGGWVLSLTACAGAPPVAPIVVRVETMATGINAGRGPDVQIRTTLTEAPRASASQGDLDPVTRRAVGSAIAREPLSEQATARIRELVAELARHPEQIVWVGCEKADDLITISGDDTYYDIWISDGGTETRYRRAGALNGRVGKIAALSIGGQEPLDANCLPDKE